MIEENAFFLIVFFRGGSGNPLFFFKRKGVPGKTSSIEKNTPAVPYLETEGVLNCLSRYHSQLAENRPAQAPCNGGSRSLPGKRSGASSPRPRTALHQPAAL